MKCFGSKTLETKRLILHKTEEKDLKELWNILCIDCVNKYYLTSKLHFNWEEEIPYQMSKLENSTAPTNFTWTIELKEDNTVIGQITIPEIEDDIRDIGWFIDPTYQHMGYAYEAAVEVLKYMFLEVEIKSIKTCAAIENKASYTLMEKLGFKRENTRKFIKYTFVEEEVECYNYTLTKKDFLKELFHKENLYVDIDIDKDPYIKHLSDDLVLNITGESGSGKTTQTEKYKNDPSCIVIDTDEVYKSKNKSNANQEVYDMLIKKYNELPDLFTSFDEVYKSIINHFKYSNKLVIVDSAQFRNLQDISILKGDIIVIRTCVNTCYKRCIERFEKDGNHTLDEIGAYSKKKKNIYIWYNYLNKFLELLDKE